MDVKLINKSPPAPADNWASHFNITVWKNLQHRWDKSQEKCPEDWGQLGGSTTRYLLVAISLGSFIKSNLQSFGRTGKRYRQAVAIVKTEQNYFATGGRSRSGVCGVTI